MTKRILAALALALILTSPVAAGEPYAGISLGKGAGTIGDSQDKIHDNGYIGGLFLGYDHKIQDKWTIGIEADIAWSDVSGSLTDGAARVTANSNWTGSIRARAGYDVTSKIMIYATGGIAFDDKTIEAIDGLDALKKSDLSLGWTLGAGAEYDLTNTITLRIEARHTQFSDFKFDEITLDQGTTYATVGVKFKLN